MSTCFVAPTESRLKVIRGGKSMLREWSVPKPVVLEDNREQMPFLLMENHSNWIQNVQRTTLSCGDYSVVGMENILRLERKNMSDAIVSVTVNRDRFLRMCERLAEYKHKAILIEATYEDMKTPYNNVELVTEAHPNGVLGSYHAIEAKFGIPIIYTSRHRELASERAACWLSKHYTYWWLDQHGYDRVLIDTDGL